MPLNFDLEQLRKQFDCKNWFETGLWDPRANVSSKIALSCGFDKVFCIELMQKWVDLGKEVFKDEIASGRYTLIQDDSTNMQNYLGDSCFSNKTMFFLDAHVDHPDINGYKKKCPLFEEIEAIKQLPRKDNVILVDDLRLISWFWGETSYGNINFLDAIKFQIQTINPAYKFGTLNGHVDNDILIAYV